MHNEWTIGDREAQAAVDAIRDRLKAEGKTAAVAVVDAHGELIAFLRVDGGKCAPIRIAINKAFTAAREERPTADIGRDARHPERGFDISYYADSRIVGWGGGVPVLHEGKVVGGIGVAASRKRRTCASRRWAWRLSIAPSDQWPPGQRERTRSCGRARVSHLSVNSWAVSSNTTAPSFCARNTNAHEVPAAGV